MGRAAYQFLIFPLAFSGLLVATLYFLAKRGKGDYRTRIGFWLIILHIGIYLAALAQVWWNPYWTDNEVQAYIAPGKRWLWAFFSAGILETILLPLLALGFFWFRRRLKP